METFTNSSFAVDNMKRGVSFSHSEDTEEAAVTELCNSKQRSYSCLTITNKCALKNYPKVIMSCYDSTSAITKEVDPEIQAVAQMFVEELLFRAQQEARGRMAAKTQVKYVAMQ